jgi:hypothetical protein
MTNVKKQAHCGQVAVTISARKFDFDSESRMRVPARRFLRWATLLASREQMMVFLRGVLVQIRCDDHKSRRWIKRREIKQGLRETKYLPSLWVTIWE